MKRWLIYFGFVEETPGASSPPAWVHLALGVLGLVVGAAATAAGATVVGVFIFVLAVPNLWLARRPPR